MDISTNLPAGFLHSMKNKTLMRFRAGSPFRYSAYTNPRLLSDKIRYHPSLIPRSIQFLYRCQVPIKTHAKNKQKDCTQLTHWIILKWRVRQCNVFIIWAFRVQISVGLTVSNDTTQFHIPRCEVDNAVTQADTTIPSLHTLLVAILVPTLNRETVLGPHTIRLRFILHLTTA